MSDQHETDFSKKHPKNMIIDPVIEKAVRRLEKNGELPCALAFDIAGKNNVAPKEVGVALDVLNIRLTKCQLGLFGYQPKKKIATPLPDLDHVLSEEIGRMAVDNRLTCRTIWEIASRLNMRKMTVSRACETLGIKIKQCQLGAF